MKPFHLCTIMAPASNSFVIHSTITLFLFQGLDAFQSCSRVLISDYLALIKIIAYRCARAGIYKRLPPFSRISGFLPLLHARVPLPLKSPQTRDSLNNSCLLEWQLENVLWNNQKILAQRNALQLPLRRLRRVHNLRATSRTTSPACSVKSTLRSLGTCTNIVLKETRSTNSNHKQSPVSSATYSGSSSIDPARCSIRTSTRW